MEKKEVSISKIQMIRDFQSKGLKTKDIARYFDISLQEISMILYDSSGIEIEGRGFTREMIRRRDNHTCQECGKVWVEGQRRFDVHHNDCEKDKTRQYDNYEKEAGNMTTYCHKCHMNLPEHRKAMSLASRNNK